MNSEADIVSIWPRRLVANLIHAAVVLNQETSGFDGLVLVNMISEAGALVQLPSSLEWGVQRIVQA